MGWLFGAKFLRLQTTGNILLPVIFLPVPKLFSSTDNCTGNSKVIGDNKCQADVYGLRGGWDLYEHLIPQQDPKLVSLFWRV